MLIISHRGNLNGPNPERENNPDQIGRTLSHKFDVEIDVWYEDGLFWLGHDEPIYMVCEDFLKQKGLWCHAKNDAALFRLLPLGVHCFAHDKDDFVLTSQGFLWHYPTNRQFLTPASIIVLQNGGQIPELCYGICCDNPMHYI